MLLFKPDNYDGPTLFEDHDGKGVVPVFPIRKEWEVGSEKYSRTMFPIVLAYAITIYKSQGVTLTKAVLDLCYRDFSVGQSYVALSRVKTIQGLMLDGDFDISRFVEKPTAVCRMRQANADLRQTQCLNP